jgi:hypothetical protein
MSAGKKKGVVRLFVSQHTRVEGAAGAGGVAVCSLCDGREGVPLPMSIDALVLWLAYFQKKHKGCTLLLREKMA